MKRYLLSIILSLCLLLFSCSEMQNTEGDLLATNDIDYNFAFIMLDNRDIEIKEITNNGDAVNLKIAYSNGKEENSFGLLLFVNGILHEYELDGKMYDMKVTELSPGDFGSLNIAFTPKVGEVDDILSLYACAVIKPEEKIDPETFIAFFEQRLLSSTQTAKITVNSALAHSDIETVELTAYTDTDKENKQIDAEFTLLPNDYAYINAPRGENQEFTLRCVGGTEPKKYRVSFYVNNKLTPVFDGFSYMDINIEPGKQAEYKIDIDTLDLPDISTFYAVVVPMDGGELDIVQKTNSLALFLSE